MISRGKRRHIRSLVSAMVWNAIPYAERQKIIQRQATAVLDAIAAAGRIPRHMLTGESR